MIRILASGAEQWNIMTAFFPALPKHTALEAGCWKVGFSNPLPVLPVMVGLPPDEVRRWHSNHATLTLPESVVGAESFAKARPALAVIIHLHVSGNRVASASASADQMDFSSYTNFIRGKKDLPEVFDLIVEYDGGQANVGYHLVFA